MLKPVEPLQMLTPVESHRLIFQQPMLQSVNRSLDLQMESGRSYENPAYENGVFHNGLDHDSARHPLPGQVGHCDYSPEHSPEGSDQAITQAQARSP